MRLRFSVPKLLYRNFGLPYLIGLWVVYTFEEGTTLTARFSTLSTISSYKSYDAPRQTMNDLMYCTTPKLLFMTLWLFVWSWSNFYVILFGVPKITVWSFRDGCAELFEMQADKKCLSIYSLFVCFSDAMVTLCDIIAVFHLFDINVKLTSSIRAA